MKFLIISDIHCVSKDLGSQSGAYHGGTGSDFYIEERSKKKNPIFSIEQALRDSDVSVDAILCLGDLAHQSKRLPFMQAWRDLHDLAERISCSHVLAVTGNHDILSRAEDVFDAEERMDFLKSVLPPFPSKDPDFNKEYFYKGYACIEISGCLIVAIDTCRLHGLGANADASKAIWEIGHITQAMHESILDRITSSDQENIIIMMHHHPVKVDDIKDIHTDAMPVGTRFIEDLGNTGKKSILMHGHKHQVNLKIATHGNPPPVIFSAATFAAKPYPQQFRDFQNLFHVLKIEDTEDSFPSGSILSWTWSGYEWKQSRHNEMPHIVPFGKRVSISEIAKTLGTLQLTSQIKRDALLSACPDLKFLKAGEFEELNELLEPLKRRIYLHRLEIDAMVEV